MIFFLIKHAFKRKKNIRKKREERVRRNIEDRKDESMRKKV